MRRDSRSRSGSPGQALVAALLLFAVVGVAAWYAWSRDFRYAYVPPPAKVANPDRLPMPAFDLLGREVWPEEVQAMRRTPGGAARLDPAAGAVAVSPETLELGRRSFYAETFGNERFMTDVLGFLDGPLDLLSFFKALVSLAGRGTDNLRLTLSKDAFIGGRQFKAGEVVDTGLDVPKGAFLPLGVVLKWSDGRLRAGVSCALCHATVNAAGDVVEGAPNADLQAGLLLAMGTNSAAYFPQAGFDPVAAFGLGSSWPIQNWPDQAAFETAVDALLLAWPPGNFDSTVDLVPNPSQIPDAFTRQGHPYGWTGFASAGPFMGLSALGNNVHGQNSDGTALLHLAPTLFKMDADVYLGLILRNSAWERYRYHPSGQQPTELLRMVDPEPSTPGLNDVVRSPSYPRISSVAPDGVLISVPGRTVWQVNNAVSAFEQGLAAPASGRSGEEVAEARFLGRQVFQRAGCAGCHSGPSLAGNRIVPVEEIGTQPSRALALAKTLPLFDHQPKLWSFDTPVPLPPDPKVLVVPSLLSPEQVDLAMAYGNRGGYKVKGLMGLAWSAPYLHDGGVAVGPDPSKDFGLPGTTLVGVRPDPANSLRAMVDRDLRAKVVAANRASARLQTVNVVGQGHEVWVDRQAGYSDEEQSALIRYLLDPGLPGVGPEVGEEAGARGLR